MHLPGRLSTSTLGDLLGALHRERTTGLLELREIRGPIGRSMPGRVHRIHLRAGLIAAIDTTLPASPAAPLRERLEALFTVEEASIAFYTARPITHVVRAAPLGPGEFLHGRPRARDRQRAGAGAPPRPARPAPRALVDDARERARRLLGIPTGAETGDVRRAFRRMASALHPDRMVAAPADELRKQSARFAELSAAYHLLVA
jgi:hypothetical protein